ncbi:MAG: glycosyltransferase [Coriobacteriia bacterium]|nr:glycosyltransferase [Coriobacteriia bacterium]
MLKIEGTIHPLFTIVIPAYNAETTIRETLLSISSQTFSDYEVVIVNDGSTDSTGEIVEQFSRDRKNVRVIHQENGGSGAAINAGLYAAVGDYICICSSDDQLISNCLEIQQASINNQPDFHIFTTAGFHFNDEEGWERPFFNAGEWKISHEITLERLLEVRFFGSGITFSRSAAIVAGGYAASVYAEDFDFYLRMLLKDYRMWFASEFCVRQGVSSVQKSANGALIKESVLTSIENALRGDNLSESNRQILESGLDLNRIQLTANERMIKQKAAIDRVLARIRNKKLRRFLQSCLFALLPIVRPFIRFAARVYALRVEGETSRSKSR